VAAAQVCALVEQQRWNGDCAAEQSTETDQWTLH
jgi:hypothetical protein